MVLHVYASNRTFAHVMQRGLLLYRYGSLVNVQKMFGQSKQVMSKERHKSCFEYKLEDKIELLPRYLCCLRMF